MSGKSILIMKAPWCFSVLGLDGLRPATRARVQTCSFRSLGVVAIAAGHCFGCMVIIIEVIIITIIII